MEFFSVSSKESSKLEKLALRVSERELLLDIAAISFFYIAKHQYDLYYLDFSPFVAYLSMFVYKMRKINQQWKELTKSAVNSVSS